MSRHSKSHGVPDRWLDYQAVGKRLHGTRFIAFKVPLKQSLNRHLSCSDVFGPWELLDALNKENQELGLIIDLTFTTRYYKIQDVPESIMCVKIFTAGHTVPTDDTILSFKRAVQRFLRDNADNDKLIGVHCTHGLNRTGYLICRYLIDVDGMDPKEAVELFNSSRGHAIERQNYIEDLQCGPKRSNEGMEEPGQDPMRGRAAHRPSASRDERRPDFGDSRYHSNEGMEEPWQDPMRGRAAHRPSASRDERRPDFGDSRYHRSLSSRGLNHSSQHHHSRNGLFPTPQSPRPPLCSPSRAPLHHPYRWAPSHSDGQWRRTHRSEDSRSRYRPVELEWSTSSWRQEDRGRGPPPPPPLPCYIPQWSDESSVHDAPEETWAGPRMRHDHRYKHNY